MNVHTPIHESYKFAGTKAPAAHVLIRADSGAFADDFSPRAHSSAPWRPVAHSCAQQFNLAKQSQTGADSANRAM